MTTWRILLTEPIDGEAIRRVEGRASFRVARGLDEHTLTKEVEDVDGIVLRARGYIGDRVLLSAPHLRVIGRHGVGVDNIDVEACTRRGVRVVNTPDANTQAVAEQVLGAMVAVARRIPAADRAVREGQWSFRDEYLGRELQGTVLGVVGLGRIGRAVATMCHRALAMQVLYSDINAFPDLEREIGATQVSLDELLERSDLVTLHIPLHDQTRGLIGERELSLLKRGAYLLNFSRGGLIDEDALLRALRTGQVAGAALDVLADEPPGPDNPLLAHPNVVLSPHNAAMTVQATRAMATGVVDDVIAVLEGHEPHYPVNEMPHRPTT